jgi:hypothetical protein
VIAQIEDITPLYCADVPERILLGFRVTFVTPPSDAEAANREAADLICARADNWEIDPKRRRVERLAKGTEARRGL